MLAATNSTNLNNESNVEFDVKGFTLNWEWVSYKLPLVHIELKCVVDH